MRPRNPNLEPKPFVWVPVPQEQPQRKEPATHECLTGFTGKLELTFAVVSEYLFVGSGGYEFDPNHGNQRPDVWYTFYRRNDKLCIPGTSIKGAIRAIVEAISNSCVSQYRRSKGERVQTHEPCRNTRQLCPACRLFGVTGFRGRVHFADALPVGEVRPQVVKIGELWEPRRYQGRKFYEVKRVPTLSDPRPQKNFRFVEALPKGTRFPTTLHFENLTEAELGLLAYALGWQPKEGKLDHAFPPKLGGAKPRCFGTVEFQLKGLQLWEHAPNRLLQKRQIPEREALGLIAGWMKRACDEHLLHEPSWKRLTDSMRAQDSTCPQEVY